MKYEVTTHSDRAEFQAYLNGLKQNQKLHIFEFLGPQVLAVYVTEPIRVLEHVAR